jgi:4-hydroxyacetophenone monooxygenase
VGELASWHSKELAEVTDQELREILRDAELPALLPALAHVTADFDLVADALRPPAQESVVVLAAQGGMTPEQQELAREAAFRTLRRLRDGELAGGAPTEDPADLRRLLAFIAGDVDDRYLPMLAFELAVPEDKDAPAWHKSDVAPERDFRVIVIGAGMSGLAVAHRLQQVGIDFTVFERNPDVGGVWLENGYPGCRLDTSNFCYSYSFRQRDDWPHVYSLRDDILGYFRDSASALGLRDRIQFETEVTAAFFDEADARWTVTVREPGGATRAYRANAVVSAVGQLNQPRFPDIPGRETFAGYSIHSARWDRDVDLSGLRVGVIGTGASSYQIVPSIAPAAGEMVLFQRTPPWTVPTPVYHSRISDGLTWLFKHVPYYSRWFRFYQFWTSVEGRRAFAIVDPDWVGAGSVSAKNHALRQMLTNKLMAEYAGRPDLQAKMVPGYPPYGKRMLRDNGVWAQSLMRDNATVETDAISEITPSGVRVSSGRHYELDALVYCTGFRAIEFLAGIDVIGRDGAKLHDQWRERAQALHGLTVPNFPNLFLIYGPNTNLVVNGSLVMFSECATHYIIESLHALLARGLVAMECRPDALDRYQEAVDRANAQMAWSVDSVQNWYKTASGQVATNWPLSTLEYFEQTRGPAEDEYRWR